MASDVIEQLRKRFILAGLALLGILTFGTTGYWLLVRPHPPLLDCLYMTVITITTIGYGEIFDLSHNPAGRVFTMGVALCGIGTLTYVLSTVTAFVVEGQLGQAFRRRKMEKTAQQMTGHYIVCGIGTIGRHIVEELTSTGRQCVVIDNDQALLAKVTEAYRGVVTFEGETSDNDLLLTAGITRAAGLFAATEDDNENMVIALTARQLNAELPVVARCQDVKNTAKMKAAGARSVISPTAIGGLRMASEMIRPTVVSFLDMMLRDKSMNLRVEELPAPLPGRDLASLHLAQFTSTLVLAVRSGGGWKFNPTPAHPLAADSILVVMTTPEERTRLAQHLDGLKA